MGRIICLMALTVAQTVNADSHQPPMPAELRALQAKDFKMAPIYQRDFQVKPMTGGADSKKLNDKQVLLLPTEHKRSSTDYTAQRVVVVPPELQHKLPDLEAKLKNKIEANEKLVYVDQKAVGRTANMIEQRRYRDSLVDQLVKQQENRATVLNDNDSSSEEVLIEAPTDTLAAKLVASSQSTLPLNVKTLGAYPSKNKMAALYRGDNYKKLRNSTERFTKALESVVENPTDTAALSEVSNLANLSFQEIKNLWNEQCLGDKSVQGWVVPPVCDELMNLYQTTSNLVQEKTIYDLPSNFEPTSYSKIAQQAQRVVGLSRSGATFCTGYLLNDEWAVTAGHCFRGVTKTTSQTNPFPGLKVSFEANSDDQYQVEQVWPWPPPGKLESDDLDYAFVKVGSTNQGQRVVDNHPNLPEVCFGFQPLGLNAPVYVIGHPQGGTMMVHDHAYVRYPFQVDQNTYTQLHLETALAFQDDQERADVMAQFENAYREISADGETFFQYFGSRFTGVERPMFGIDTDTYSGNSGSAVFDRRSHCVIGVFNAGSPDFRQAFDVSWQDHEVSVPFNQVYVDITARMQDSSEAPSELLNFIDSNL